MRISDWSSDVCSTDLESSGFPAIGLVRGPNGGTLASEGFGRTLALTETHTDGRKTHYGRQPYYIGDPRSAGNWLSGDGLRALLGVRTSSPPRNGLRLVERGVGKECVCRGSYGWAG